MLCPIKSISPKIFLVLIPVLLSSLLNAFRSITEKRFTDAELIIGAMLDVSVALGLIMLGDTVGLELVSVVLIIFSLQLLKNFSVLRQQLLKFFQRL